jgi:hypothetical protein
MYGSITQLEMKSEQDLEAAVRGLEKMLSETHDVEGLRDCYVFRTGANRLTMVTVYDTEAASRRAAEQYRPKLAKTVGPHVARPPERLAGEVAVGLPD